MSRLQTRRSRRREVSAEAPQAAVTEISISTAMKVGAGEEIPQEQETIHLRKDVNVPHPAYIRVAGGKTVNLGNYESLRVDIAIEMPCAPTQEGILETYEEATGLLDQLMEQRLPDSAQ